MEDTSSSEEDDGKRYYRGFNQNKGKIIEVIPYVKNNELSENENNIAEMSRYIDYAPYAHNIVGLDLGEIQKELGNDAANAMIMKYGLNEKGWNEVHFK